MLQVHQITNLCWGVIWVCWFFNMPSQAAMRCSCQADCIDTPGVSLLHHQALLGATLVNGEDQRATWRKRCSHQGLEKGPWKVSSWRINAARLIRIHFFQSFTGNPNSLSPKAKLKNGVLKKNMPFSQTLALFTLVSNPADCRICIHFDSSWGKSWNSSQTRGRPCFKSAVSVRFFFFASKV